MPNTYDFAPFPGGVSVKINGDDGNDLPAGLYKIYTRGAFLDIVEIPTGRTEHSLDMTVDTATISGGSAVAGADAILKATAVRIALQAIFFNGVLSNAIIP